MAVKKNWSVKELTPTGIRRNAPTAVSTAISAVSTS